MMTVGSICTGYAGLELALSRALAAPIRTTWHAEIDPAACRVLTARYPGIPNLGDITAVNWADVDTVDWLVAGYPCQPFSDAGLRKGIEDERHLWPYVATAIRHLRPRYVLLENVRGHLRRGFDRVLNSLASCGYVGSWVCVRASDIGAPHRRERLFVIAADASRLRQRHSRTPSNGRLPTAALASPADTVREADPAGDPVRRLIDLLPTPRASDHTGANVHGDGGLDLRTAVVLVQPDRWGRYRPAIDQWANLTGRPAPAPVEQWPGGQSVLSPRFVEWMMGLDDGWVTRAPRITRNDALRVLGAGVVPQQGEHAIRRMLLVLP